jgi:uncharacterized protein (DUF952 family)
VSISAESLRDPQPVCRNRRTLIAVLFHLSTREAWQRAVAIGDYLAPSLEDEGFIHLSTEDQWPGVRARFFADAIDLVLLVIDASRLRHEIRYELADGEQYPHLYGPLDVSAVIEAREL